MYGEKRGAYRVWVGNPKERYQLEYLGIVLRIILKRKLKEIRWEGVDWIVLAQG